MTKVDLITGFLGSGKTTFLKKYALFLLDSGQKIGILENDYGAVNVDMMLLSELLGENCELETVAGACDYDCHKRRFKTKLIAMGMQGFDRVIIEPSGIFDVDEFFDVLHEEPLDRWYEIGSVIAIVDALSDDEFSHNSSYLLASQVANAGAVVLSKTQFADKDKINTKIDTLNKALEKVQCDRRFGDDIISKDWSDFTADDFKKIGESGYTIHDYTKNILDDNNYSSLYFMNSSLSVKQLKIIVKKLLSGENYGKIFRVKGFIKSDEKWYELNATKKQFELNSIDNGQEIIIVIGENLNDEEIRKTFEN
ncbi:MAG: GTP-binding protein [Ruminococcus sp.]|nr:GTP-binding protein [Ruminococcus sp.]